MVALDLRHVASPALRDLIHLVNHPDFDRTHQQIEHLGGCTEPVRLIGQTTTIDTATGEVLRSYTTADEPTGSLLMSCGNRRASRCPACSRVYAADTFQLIRAGLTGGKSVPDTVRTHPRVFATLTAPSFGPVHNRPTDTGGAHRPCRCGKLHEPMDALLGTPLDPKTYDYPGAVLFNAHAGALWARFTIYLRREIAARLGLTQKAARAVLRVSFAKVAEYQKRGLVHFHSVIRLDGPDGSTQPPPPSATATLLADAIRAAAARVSVSVVSDAVGERELAWGEQLDVREIAAFGTDAELTDHAVAAYVAKYATKSADSSGALDRALFCRPCQGRGMTLTGHGTPLQCTACGGTGQARPLPRLAVERHVRQMIRTCWELGKRPEFADLKLWKWAHMLGFRGHFSTKSRCYSVTLGQLRDDRRAWRAEQARAHAGLPDLDPNTTLVIGHWTYHGSGYNPGAQLLAAAVWHRRELERQFTAEGGY
ncbi:replication initiator [Kitasatospora purpeofusca]|uniref:replication initiator n=1 Tax=Kitasatospora purpeofusca TaxID=67352 RepID=UPI0022545ED9|nr:replication initiator [Kitasatospora purpeofusca]MCX4757002.1 zinc finger-like domain-containing protein [Kitasatospora purpeofusca]WSR35231.1 zinc finger-like domain-containing protein [Kitasatospora purpeofusca]